MQLTLDMPIAPLQAYLEDKELIATNNVIESIEKPGEGNMNVVLRAVGSAHNVILKQSRPFVNKYPQIAAPADRIDKERQFYNLAKLVDGLGDFLPRILGYVEGDRLLALEDLGSTSDYTYLYQLGAQISKDDLDQARLFLDKLHGHSFDAMTVASFPRNAEMRTLNHEHIFKYPFMEENGLDLNTITSGLGDFAKKYQNDSALKSKALKVGERYFGSGQQLLHGDFFFGSWLKTDHGFKVIDPEFCFFGPAEFDVGVMLAHLDMARQIYDVDSILGDHSLDLDRDLVQHFQGMEIMRRIIGLAQLPLTLSLEEKKDLLERAYEQLMQG